MGLSDACLAVTPGEFVIVIGGNGSGKSTLLRTVAGFVNPDSGSVWLEGVDVTTAPPHKRSQVVALVDQDPARSCASDLTVAETVALSRPRRLSAEFLPLLRGQDATKLRRQLASYSSHLGDLWQSTVGDLSGGERQMLAMATALLRGCRVFLLDEHTAALDHRNSEQVWQVTIDLQRREGKTVIVVTHDIDHALELDGRLIVMLDGAVTINAAPHLRARFTRQMIIDTYLGAKGASDDRIGRRR